MHSPLQDEGNHRCAKTDFFENGRNHERPIARGVHSDEDKGDLLRQSDSHESIEESWMRDRRRVVASDKIEHKVQRREGQQAPMSATQNTIFANFIAAP